MNVPLPLVLVLLQRDQKKARCSIKFLAVHCINNGLVSIDTEDEERVESVRESNVLDDIMDVRKLFSFLEWGNPTPQNFM